jgi:hypothetical protein
MVSDTQISVVVFLRAMGQKLRFEEQHTKFMKNILFWRGMLTRLEIEYLLRGIFNTLSIISV